MGGEGRTKSQARAEQVMAKVRLSNGSKRNKGQRKSQNGEGLNESC